MCVDPTQQIGNSSFTDTDVLAFANQQMEQSGTTTTLDVKNLLRDGGFKAFQADVSLAMDRLAVQEDWHWTFNGVFRVFSVPDDLGTLIDVLIDSDDDDLLAQTPSAKIVITTTPALPDPADVVLYTAVPRDGDWQVFDYKKTKPVVHVKGGVTRNAARNWYSGVYGIDYLDVAANIFNAS